MSVLIVLCLMIGKSVQFGSVGAFAGARITSLYVPPNRLKQLFGILIVVVTGYKLATIIL